MLEGDFKHRFLMETNGIKEGSPKWWALRYKYEMMAAGEEPVENFRRSMVRSILNMSGDIKHLQVSSFNRIPAERVMRIGAAMTVLHDELKKNGLTNTQGDGFIKKST